MNPIKQIFTGGACNADEMQRGRAANNPFNNFMQYMLTGREAARQKGERFYPEEEANAQMMMRQQFDNTWNDLAVEFQQKARMEDAMMNQMWEAERMRLIELNRQRALAQQQAWNEAVQLQQAQEMQAHANNWTAQFTEQYNQELMEKTFGEEEQKVVDKEMEQNTIKHAAGDMMEVMMSDPDPKFKESKFLSFLSKLQTGELKIEGDELIEDPTKAVIKPQEEMMMGGNGIESEDEEFKDDKYGKLYEEAWNLAQNGKEAEADAVMQKLEAEYSKILAEMEKAQQSGDKDREKDLMADAWQRAQEIEEHSLYRDIGPYSFQKNNPFLGENQPLEKALMFISAGRTMEAILALEAHLQRTPEDAVHWRVLGRLHQENDMDQPAVSCLLTANQIDPTHLDTHLSLGVSCTNILDEVRAMHHMNKWLLFNPKYKALGINPQIIPFERLNGDFKIEEIKKFSDELMFMFNKALQIDSEDPGLHSALAVLFFMQRNYEMSVESFQKALQYDVNNYSLWNKLGATQAHLGRTELAMEAYHRALDLKPNFVRVWVNLGIAHAFKQDYEEAARFYLNALSFNPNAAHLWSYLNSTFVCMERLDLVEKIKNHDVNQFRGDFDIISIADLPAPEIEYKQAHIHYVVQQEAKDWGNEFDAMMMMQQQPFGPGGPPDNQGQPPQEGAERLM